MNQFIEGKHNKATWHFESVHEVIKVKCGICPSSFELKDRLIESVHEGKTFT